MSTEFQSRMLYTQKSTVQHEHGENSVSSTVYAIRFLYPGASQHTMSRIRITCVYKETIRFEAHSAAVEKWSDKGWVFVDDYAGDMFSFISESEFRKRMLDYAHSFMMGIPISIVDKNYISDAQISGPSKKDNPFKSFDFKSKNKNIDNKKNNEEVDNYKKEDKSSDDDDDLDWL